MKQFSVYYESDRIECRSNTHHWADASSLKTAKSYFKRIRKSDPSARNIRIYDTWADLDPITNHTPIIYSEN